MGFFDNKSKEQKTKKSGISLGVPNISDLALFNMNYLPDSGSALYEVLKSLLSNPAVGGVLDVYTKNIGTCIVSIKFDKEDGDISVSEAKLLKAIDDIFIKEFQKLLSSRMQNLFLCGSVYFDFDINISTGFKIPYNLTELPPDSIEVSRDIQSGKITGFTQEIEGEKKEITNVFHLFRDSSTYNPNGVSFFYNVFLHFKNSTLAQRKIKTLIENIGNGAMVAATGFANDDVAKEFRDLYTKKYDENSSCPNIVAGSGDISVMFHEHNPQSLQFMNEQVRQDNQAIFSSLLLGQNNAGQQGNSGAYASSEVLFNQFLTVVNGTINEIEDYTNRFIESMVKAMPNYSGDTPAVRISPNLTAEGVISLLKAMGEAGVNTSNLDVESTLLKLTPFVKKEQDALVDNVIDNTEDETDNGVAFALSVNKEVSKKPRAFANKRALTQLEADSSDIDKFSKELVKWTDESGKRIQQEIYDVLENDLKNVKTQSELREAINGINLEPIKDTLQKSITKLAEISFNGIAADYKKQGASGGSLKAFSSKSGFSGLKDWMGEKYVALAGNLYDDFDSWANDYIDAMAQEITAEIQRESWEVIRTQTIEQESADKIASLVLETIAIQKGDKYIKQVERYGTELVGAFREIALGDVPVKSLVRTAIRDSNTCAYCRARDNEIYYWIEEDNGFYSKNGEQAASLPDVKNCLGKWFCRCFFVYIFA